MRSKAFAADSSYVTTVAFLRLTPPHQTYLSRRHMLVIAQPPRPFSAILGVGRSCMIFLKSYVSHHTRATHHAVQLALAHHHVGAERLQTTEDLAVLAASGHATPVHLHVLHDVDGLDAARLAELNHRHAHRGGGVVLHQEVAGLQLGEIGEESVRNTRGSRWRTWREKSHPHPQ